MDSFLDQLREAHEEVMVQTGWRDTAGNLSELFADLPYIARGFLEEARLFFEAVNWREPFFTYLAAFHLAVAALVLYLVFVRWRPRGPRGQGASHALALAGTKAEERLFALSLALVMLSFAAYPLNNWGIDHGERLFTEKGVNYFTSNGLFIAVVYWLPLVALAVLVQGKLVFNVIRLFIVVKREQIASQLQQRERAAGKDAVAGSEETKKKN